MPPWDLTATRNAIERKFGRQQYELARPCLRSLWDRQFYARFHYQRAEATLKRYVRTHLTSKDFLRISLGADPAEWDRFNIVIRKLGADLTACVQSMHALPDILANAVYFSLALNERFVPAAGKYVNHAFVCDHVRKFSDLSTLLQPLRSGCTGQGFKHIAALANQSKHYSIIFPVFHADLTGKRKDQYMLAFPEFKTTRKNYPQAYVVELLPPIHEQISRSVVTTGHAMAALL